MIGIHARRGCLCSRISVITTLFGGECLIGRYGCVGEFDNNSSGTAPSQETEAPIVYSSLQEWHLDQVHDLLTRTFWSGIDSGSSTSPCTPPLTDDSKRFPALPTGTCNGYSNVQTAGCWRRDPQITAGNVHNLSGSETWLG